MNNTTFQTTDIVRAVNIEPLEGNDEAPPLELGKEYPVLGICVDKAGNQHLDVGIVSKLGYVRSYETKEQLPNSGHGKIHWCHPSRFEKVQPKDSN